MSETHVNAFWGAVDEAKAELAQAQAKVDAAEVALKAHPDYVAPGKEAKEEPDESKEEQVNVEVKKPKK